MSIDEKILSQLNKCEIGNYEYIKDSGWLNNVSHDELESMYQEYINDASEICESITKKYGKPKHDRDSGFFSDWYPEAIFGQGWQVDNKILFLTVEHHDSETPIGIVLGALSLDQINQLTE